MSPALTISNPEVSKTALDSILNRLQSIEGPPSTVNADDQPLEEDPLDKDVNGATKFEGAEHRAIGDALTLKDIDGNDQDATKFDVLTIPGKVNLKIGQVISLAGDFYTNTNQDYAPISGAFVPFKGKTDNPEARFSSMVNAITTDVGSYLKSMSATLDQEHEAVTKAANGNPGTTAQTYAKKEGMAGDVKVTWQTADLPALDSAYPHIAWTNADHFGNDAVITYQVGHSLACNAAIAAGKNTDPRIKADLLKRAYFIEGCALHYLTDLFSSGHMRAPRRAFHHPDYAVMTRARITFNATSAWDFMCRTMHDDDSSTGLLCTNSNGDQWIAFGDKQLYMPANAVNRARAVHAAQTSVNEVYNYCRRAAPPNNENLATTPNTTFDALALLPSLPATVNDKKNWATFMDNPAALWVAGSSNEPSLVQKWRYRDQVNNHASYTLSLGHPGFRDENSKIDNHQSAVCDTIQSAAFQKATEQYPIATSVTPNAGILQLSQAVNVWPGPDDFANSDSAWPVQIQPKESVFANIWTPVENIPNIDNDDFKTITLGKRQLLSQLGVVDSSKAPLVHAMKYYDTSTDNMAVIAMRLRYGNDGADKATWDLQAMCFDVNDPNQDSPNKWDFSFNRPLSQAVLTPRWNGQYRTIASSEGTVEVNVMDLRCFITDNGTADPEYSMLTVLCGESAVYYWRMPLSADDLDDPRPRTAPLAATWYTKGEKMWSSRPFIKLFTGSTPSDRSILFCQNSILTGEGSKDASFQVKVKALVVTSSEDGWKRGVQLSNEVAVDRIIYKGPDQSQSPPAYYKVRSSCFMVGDVFGLEVGDQLVSVVVAPAYLQLDIFGQRDISLLKKYGVHYCSDKIDDPKAPYRKSGADNKGYKSLRNYLVALVASQPPADGVAKPGLDVLQISLHKDSGRKDADGPAEYWLKFKTHVNLVAQGKKDLDPTDASHIPEDCFGSCTTNWIKDDLMTKERYSEGYYQSLNWLYVPHKELAHGIMEIFSWYGVLGLRYFAAEWNGNSYNYKMVGLQPFNGQTSGTIGRGIYGTWGEGFMTHGTTDGFRDVVYSNLILGKPIPKPGELPGQGYWDSQKQDPYASEAADPPLDQLVKESDYLRGSKKYVTLLE